MTEFTREDRKWLWLHLTFGSDVKVIYALLSGGEQKLDEIFEDARRGRVDPALKLSPDQQDKLKRFSSERSVTAFLKRIEEIECSVVTLASPNYPALLREIPMAPPLIYFRGTLPDEIPFPFSVIGKRDCSSYGRDMATKLARELAACGMCIVSGMARGIDGIASEAALSIAEHPYPTIAVLGSGIDTVYPRENAGLYRKIALRGAVITEFFPGAEPAKEHFPQRNRLISGLSNGLLVIEAGEHSGTSITVNYAIEQNRNVYCVPGRLTDKSSAGTNAFIRDSKAKLVTCIEDILVDYGLDTHLLPSLAILGQKSEKELSENEKMLVELLRNGDLSFDELFAEAGLDMNTLNSTLTALDISGIIKQLPGGGYTLVTSALAE